MFLNKKFQFLYYCQYDIELCVDLSSEHMKLTHTIDFVPKAFNFWFPARHNILTIKLMVNTKDEFILNVIKIMIEVMNIVTIPWK